MARKGKKMLLAWGFLWAGGGAGVRDLACGLNVLPVLKERTPRLSYMAVQMWGRGKEEGVRIKAVIS